MDRRPSGIVGLAIAMSLVAGSLTFAYAPATAAQAACGTPGQAATPGAVLPDAASGEWQPLPDLPRPRSEFGAATIGASVYVAGGFGGLAMVDCLNLATGSWEQAPDLPVGIHHPGVAALDGVLYVAGGYTEEGGATDALWALDPAAGSWEARAPMPTARGALGLAALDGRLYAVGGATEGLGGPVTGAVEVYDPDTDTWKPAAELPTPREHLAVAAGEGRVFAVGGRANGQEVEEFAAATEAFDPATGQWETLPPLPTPRGGVSGSFAAGYVVVLGGERGTTTFDTAEAFDTTTGEWTTLPPLPVARHGIASAALGDTVIAVAGSTQAGAVANTGATQALTLPASAGGQATSAELEPVRATRSPSAR